MRLTLSVVPSLFNILKSIHFKYFWLERCLNGNVKGFPRKYKKWLDSNGWLCKSLAERLSERPSAWPKCPTLFSEFFVSIFDLFNIAIGLPSGNSVNRWELYICTHGICTKKYCRIGTKLDSRPLCHVVTQKGRGNNESVGFSMYLWPAGMC